MPYLTPTSDGVILNLHIVPRATKNLIQGLHGDALKIRLNAPPVEGAANTALIQFLAKTLDLPRARLQLLAGQTSRAKKVLVLGVKAADIRPVLSPPQ